MKFKFNENVCKCIIVVVLSVIVGYMLYKQSRRMVIRENFSMSSAGLIETSGKKTHIVFMQKDSAHTHTKDLYHIIAIKPDGTGSTKTSEANSPETQISSPIITGGTLSGNIIKIDNSEKYWESTLKIYPTDKNATKIISLNASDYYTLTFDPQKIPSTAGALTVAKFSGPSLPLMNPNISLKTNGHYWKIVLDSSSNICYLIDSAAIPKPTTMLGASGSKFVTPNAGAVTESAKALLKIDVSSIAPSSSGTTVSIVKSILLVNTARAPDKIVIIIFRTGAGVPLGYVEYTGALTAPAPAALQINTSDSADKLASFNGTASTDVFAKIADMHIETDGTNGAKITLLTK